MNNRRHSQYDYDHDRSGHRHNGRGHTSSAWKWVVGLTVAAVVYTNNGGDLSQLFNGLFDGTGSGTNAPVTHSTPARTGGGGYKAPCTQYFKGGC
jgi:hypothetical protein